jgi:hypothetical protein
MNWPLSLQATKRFTLKCNQMSILHEHLANNKIIHIDVDLKWLSEVHEC